MSIDRNVFIREFSALLHHHGRTANDLVTQRYREFLNQHLTTEEFEQASKFILLEDQFFPTARRFVDVVKGNAKDVAAADWQKLLQLAQAGDSDISGLSAPAVAAMKAAGGWRAVAYAESEFALSQVRRAFIDAHTTQATQPARPQLEAQPVLELEAVS